jgi:hypothetical protein
MKKGKENIKELIELKSKPTKKKCRAIRIEHQ